MKLAKSGANVDNLSSPQNLIYNFRLYCQEFVYGQHTREELTQVNNLMIESSKIQYSREFISFKKQATILAKQHLSVQEFDTKFDLLVRQAVSQLNDSEEIVFVRGAVAFKSVYHSWMKNKDMLEVIKFVSGAKNNKISLTRIASDCKDGCKSAYNEYQPSGENISDDDYGYWQDRGSLDVFEPDWNAIQYNAWNTGFSAGGFVGAVSAGVAASSGALTPAAATAGVVGSAVGFVGGFVYGYVSTYVSQQNAYRQNNIPVFRITQPVIITPCP